MSSWDRSRSIPWSRIIVPAAVVAPSASSNDNATRENVELMRERIWRDLAREAVRSDDTEMDTTISGNPNTSTSTSSANSNSVGTDGNLPSSSSSSSSSSYSHQDQEEQSREWKKQQPSSQSPPETNLLGYVGRPYQTSDLLRNLAFGATIGSITGMCFGFMDSIRSAQSIPLLKSASRDAQGKFIFQGTYRSGLFYGSFFGMFHTIKYGVRTVIDPGDIGEISAASVVTLGGMFAKREWRASLPYAVMLVGMDGFHIFMREEGKV